MADPAQLLRQAGLNAQALEPLAGGGMGEVWRAGRYTNLR
ncbi:hypothetical protein Mrose_00547 [Calidithermus roseus]|uniref:Uncharacterized protein n=1 Tax=Calidithermus roseus TaxID=1644118 RepID=A0A399F2U9_9DEIN|nr:hypothetical protein Mrose_00547 [Calidithermus roseus]